MSTQHALTYASGIELNAGALSAALIAAVNGLCDSAEDGSAGTALLIQLQAGPAPEATEPVDVSLVNQWERALRRLERVGIPTVATVDGACGACGLALLLATDYRIVTPRLRLGLALGGEAILPGMVLHRLASQIGAAHARRVALFGAELNAATASILGLADLVSEEPAPAAAAFIGGLSGTTLSGLAVRRRLVLEASSGNYEDSLGTHLAACDRALRAAVRADALLAETTEAVAA